jgi:hypothetical protein
VVEEVEVGRDMPPVLMLYSVTIPPTFRIHPSSGGWTMDPSETVVLAESLPIRRKDKLNFYGNVTTDMIRLTCRMKIMHVKR